MPWPTPQQYQEALQNPRQAFKHSELQGSNPELDLIGFPRPISGNFASVYKMRSSNGVFAVRCFLRNLPDQQRRYEAIHRALDSANLPYTVGFEYISEGVRVGSSWYPILKMEWVQGRSLINYVQKNLFSSEKISLLAAHWIKMTQDMRKAGIAHGDLQHGNVLIVNGNLKLIDYDGMYVEELAGKISNELGHRNYQHPARSPRDFDSTLDNFSSWVIYLSLLALSIEPGLLEELSGGDENILLRKDDFERPEASLALRMMEQLQDGQLQSAITHFKSFLYLPPSNVPALRLAIKLDWNRTKSSSQTPDLAWWDDHHSRSGKSPTPNVVDSLLPNIVHDAGWVTDHLLPSHFASPIDFTWPSVGMRLFSYTTAGILSITSAVCVFMGISLWVSLSAVGSLLAIMLIILARAFLNEPNVTAKRKAGARLQEMAAQAKSAAASQTALRNEQDDITAHFRKDRLQLQRELEALEENRKEGLARIDTVRAESARSLERLRKDALNEKALALTKLAAETYTKRASIDSRRNNLHTEENASISKALEIEQNRHIQNFLARCELARASVPGIGDTYKASLKAAGYRTAADISTRVSEVRGIGSARCSALLKWRDSLKATARKSLPLTLSPTSLEEIRRNFGHKYSTLDTELRTLSVNNERDEKLIHARSKGTIDSIDRKVRELERSPEHEKLILSSQYEKKINSVEGRIAQLSQRHLSNLNVLKNRMKDIDGKIWKCNMDLAQLHRELAVFRRLTFIRYLQTVFGF